MYPHIFKYLQEMLRKARQHHTTEGQSNSADAVILLVAYKLGFEPTTLLLTKLYLLCA